MDDQESVSSTDAIAPTASDTVAPSPDGAPTSRGMSLRAAALYPRAYTWFVFLAAIDLMFTWTILFLGGREVNWLANHVIRRHGLIGVVALKFGVVVLVILICEIVGRRRHELGRRLAACAVAISLIPVSVGFVELIVAISRVPAIIDGKS